MTTSFSCKRVMNDLFVVKPGVHVLLRMIAVFVVAPILIIKGLRYEDHVLLLLGLGTLIIDSWTLAKSVRQYV